MAHDIWFLSGQVVYEDEDDETMSLVVVARSGDKQQAWVQAIRDGMLNNSPPPPLVKKKSIPQHRMLLCVTVQQN